MIYHNPKKIIERFLKRFDSSEKIRKNNDFELFSNIISENLSKIQKRENSVKYEKLESAYIAEFLKKKNKKTSKKALFSKSQSIQVTKQHQFFAYNNRTQTKLKKFRKNGPIDPV